VQVEQQGRRLAGQRQRRQPFAAGVLGGLAPRAAVVDHDALDLVEAIRQPVIQPVVRPVAALAGLDAVVTAAVHLHHRDRADLPAVADGGRRRHDRAQQVLFWSRLARRIDRRIFDVAIVRRAVEQGFPVRAGAAQAGRLVRDQGFPALERLAGADVAGEKLGADHLRQHAARLGRVGPDAVQHDLDDFDGPARDLRRGAGQVAQVAHFFQQGARSARTTFDHAQSAPAGL